ncbi:MAG TPA: T9SS type A sorting domain-containing protein, partial [Salinimicrobium sp.]|nr:T9SS type A sorting domain-containing protein [Salinimicrobium sp.]
KNNAGDFINANTSDYLVVAHYTGGMWKNEEGSLTPGSDVGIGGQGSISIQNISSFSPFTFGSTELEGILPVELVSFVGVNKDKENVLTWGTASEKDNSHFEIEKSVDGETFERIGQVNGNGNSYEAITYNFSDHYLTSSQAYYRLKQVDFDGKFEYSKIVLINSASFAQEIQLYPNPVTRSAQFVTIDLEGLNLKKADVVIRNTNGHVVSGVNLNDAFGLGKEELDISNLRTGIYLVDITTAHGKVVKRLIVR